jgi:hypothetical protein
MTQFGSDLPTFIVKLLLFMNTKHVLLRVVSLFFFIVSACSVLAQGTSFQKLNKSNIYVGIEVGSKGVKMSVVEIGKNARQTGAFQILKDTSVNTDFIAFTDASFSATLQAFAGLFEYALNQVGVPSKHIFTVVSSGVKMQADKQKKAEIVQLLIASFRTKINEPQRSVEVVDVKLEARLSHLGIVPDVRRFNTFLIDIGSGNSKGGYFPYTTTEEFRLFQLNWGTKSVAGAVEKGLEGEVTLTNYYNQLTRVLNGAEATDIVYAINASGAYSLNDNIAFSGGIAWSVATLIYPELLNNNVVPVTYDDVLKFSSVLYSNFKSISPELLARRIKDPSVNKNEVLQQTQRVYAVFDQKSLMAGTGLMLKIMRQFKSAYESKQFYLVKNGHVGWISAYVSQSLQQD